MLAILERSLVNFQPKFGITLPPGLYYKIIIIITSMLL